MKELREPYTLSPEEVAHQLDVSERGLPEAEVKSRIATYGRNEFKAKKRKSPILIFLSQFNNIVVYLLLVAVVVSSLFKDYTEAIAILAVILINTIIGFIMEMQARKSMNALKKLDQMLAKVIRNGTVKEISSEEIVPGDWLVLEAGDVIPADGRISSDTLLEVDESPLTGESLPVSKENAPLPSGTTVADRKNMVFKGTFVTRGNAKAIVTGTGAHTELGKISFLVERAGQQAVPINEKLKKFSQKLIFLIFIVIVPLLFVGLAQRDDLHEVIETSIALAVAAIPEGLPIVSTIALARGMLKLARHQVIVKKLAAVETLGSTNVIFTDKTGTLTQNKLRVHTLCFAENIVQIRWDESGGKIHLEQFENHHTNNEGPVGKLLMIGVLCNNAQIGTRGEPIGDPLEIALLKAGEYYRKGFIQDLQKEFPRISEKPFDSKTKWMATVHKSGTIFFTAMKGAAEEVLKNCHSIVKGNTIELFSEEKKKDWLERTNSLAREGLRTLAFAWKESACNDELLDKLVFAGLIGFADPPREEVPQAIKECRQAGLRVVMVTGDHPETAKNIAYQVGLIDSKDEQVLHGSKLKPVETLSENEKKEIMNTVIFSRVSPEQKLDLISLYQRHGWLVGMTGDGVNDAPALKKAEIGIAMGKRGTQVAREAADMVLKDDSFASIAKAIKYGRVIYDNIKTFVIYLLSCNLSEIIIVSGAAFLNVVQPLLPLQILFLNLVTDVFPALALGMNEGSELVMKKKPRNPDEPLINKQNWTSIAAYSLLLSLSVFASFFYAYRYLDYSPAMCNSIAFLSLAFAQLLHPLNLASAKESFFRNEITTNRYLLAAIVLCTMIIMAAYVVQPLKEVLSIQTLDGTAWGLVAAGSLLHLVLIQLVKRTNVVK